MNEGFIITLSLLFVLYLYWGFRFLPQENRQILAVFPAKKMTDGNWQGTNLTYYGLLVANAVTVASGLYLILMASLGTAPAASFSILTVVLLLAMPAARVVAGWVEDKPNTFSTGAASFVGLLTTFAAIFIVNQVIGPRLGFAVEAQATLAVLSICYCIGEGLGRLACISFGCCYGKPLRQSHPLLQRAFTKFHFVFQGKTKKISYAEGWEHVPMIPIQGVTAIVCLTAGLIGVGLFAASHFTAAFVVTLLLSQMWRFFSEFLRSDYRGEGRLSTYQILAILTFCFGVLMTLSFSNSQSTLVVLEQGMSHIAKSGSMLLLFLIWTTTIFYLGRSKVTGATISFCVHQDKI